MQLSVTVRNARLDAIESTIGTAPTLKVREGSPPSTCASSDTGAVLASMTLPSDWLEAAASGSKEKSGTWRDLSADNSGTAGHFRIYDSSGTCHLQGDITVTGGGGDMTVGSTTIVIGQRVTVTGFMITDGNA